MTTTLAKKMQLFGATLGWLAIVAQLILIIVNRLAPIPETIVRFFSYFTILTNIIVAVAFTALLNGFGERWKQFFQKPSNFTGVTAYILLVGIVYNAILRWQLPVTGWGIPVNEALHLIIPLFVVCYWYLFVSKAVIAWSAAFIWAWYLLAYCVYILVRGHFSHFYPYPFMNVDQFGYGTVLINCLYVTVAFFVPSLTLISISKWLHKSVA